MPTSQKAKKVTAKVKKVPQRLPEESWKAILVPGIELPARAHWAKNIHWLYSIGVDPIRARLDRDMLSAKLAEYGVETRAFFYPLHIQPPYLHSEPETFSVTSELAQRGLSFPTANEIRLEDVDKVCAAISEIVATAHALRTHAAA